MAYSRTQGYAFLQQDPQARLHHLQTLGLARYAPILTVMPLTEVNCTCVMRFLQDPARVKFPLLQGVELPGVNLDGVNLIRADLTEANLQGSSLRKADLLLAKLTRANLRQVCFEGATLHETSWDQAQVQDCDLGQGIGLTTAMIQTLRAAGAQVHSKFC